MDELVKFTLKEIMSGKTHGCDAIDAFRLTTDHRKI